MKNSTNSLLALHAACEPIFAAFYADQLDSAQKYSETPERDAMDRSCALLASTSEGAALLTAIDAAQWGSQVDGTFVTSQHNAHWIANSGDCCGVHAPAKQGELVVASVHHDAPHFVLFVSRVDAMTKREAQRASSRAGQAAYSERLDLVAAQLRAAGARWYRSGAFGGVLLFDDPALDQSDDDMPRVSTRGALSRAWGVRCTCGRRAGHHAERLPVVACPACDRAEAFGFIAEQFRESVKWEIIDGVHHGREDRIYLFADGALCEHSGEWIAWGPLAIAEARSCNSAMPESLRMPIREWTP